jgi:8-amino-7-oxononanoate synthase
LTIPILQYDRLVAPETGPSERRLVDFTSSLYLGMRHPSCSLRPWSQLTTGKPGALETAPSAAAIAGFLAQLQGCESAILLPSTLHLFFDLFEILGRSSIVIYADAAAYKIALWGAERVTARGVTLRRIGHYDPVAACRAITKDDRGERRPVILADGFCPQCGRPAPLPEYLRCVVPYDGYVVLDDTQALGIWGAEPGLRRPYGLGGGGSLQLHAIRSPNVILGSSLAKAFGVPLAVLCASKHVVEIFRRQSQTLVHTSPPSIGVLRAAEHALSINEQAGDELRLGLGKLVSHFRRTITLIGLSGSRALFPAQMIALSEDSDAALLKQLLLRAGVRTAIVRGTTATSAKLVFLITVLHSIADIDYATRVLAHVIRDYP